MNETYELDYKDEHIFWIVHGGLTVTFTR